MKNYVAIIIAALLVLSLTFSAFAEDVTVVQVGTMGTYSPFSY